MMRAACISHSFNAHPRMFVAKLRRSSRVHAAVQAEQELEALTANEKTAPRMTAAEQVRTLVKLQKFGTVCTASCAPETAGYPFGAVLPYACDDDGRLICALSSLSGHRKDLEADGKASVVVAAEGFNSMTNARCTVTGRFAVVDDADDAASCREQYLEAHPDSYWVDFGDFAFFRMDEIVAANLVGGFGRVAKVRPDDYLAAPVDPVAAFSKPVCGHMNDDHADSIISIIKHSVGVTCEEARMLAIDRLGMDTEVIKDGDKYNVRVAWPDPAEDRKSVKDRIVAMSRAAAQASADS